MKESEKKEKEKGNRDTKYTYGRVQRGHRTVVWKKQKTKQTQILGPSLGFDCQKNDVSLVLYYNKATIQELPDMGHIRWEKGRKYLRKNYSYRCYK